MIQELCSGERCSPWASYGDLLGSVPNSIYNINMKNTLKIFSRTIFKVDIENIDKKIPHKNTVTCLP